MIRLLFALVLGAFVARAAAAEGYPEHSVRIVVPAGPAGSLDVVGRLIANKLSEQFGQAFFVENHNGAGTIVGTQLAASAPADGYTLLVGGLSNMVFNFALYQKLPYDPDDFVPVALISTFPFVMVASNSLPQRDVAEIIAYARQSPGKLRIAHAGTGSSQQIVDAAFARMTNTSLIDVPYRTTLAAYPDLMSGRVDLLFNSIAAARPYISANRVRGLAVLAPQRDPKVPGLPTMTEAGLAGLDVESWIGLFAPARTPPEVLSRLRQETRIAAADLKGQLEKTGGHVMQMTTADTVKFIKSEFDLWTRVIHDAGIRLD